MTRIQIGTDFIEANGDPQGEKEVVRKFKRMRAKYYAALKRFETARWQEKENILLKIETLKLQLQRLQP